MVKIASVMSACILLHNDNNHMISVSHQNAFRAQTTLLQKHVRDRCFNLKVCQQGFARKSEWYLQSNDKEIFYVWLLSKTAQTNHEQLPHLMGLLLILVWKTRWFHANKKKTKGIKVKPDFLQIKKCQINIFIDIVFTYSSNQVNIHYKISGKLCKYKAIFWD